MPIYWNIQPLAAANGPLIECISCLDSDAFMPVVFSPAKGPLTDMLKSYNIYHFPYKIARKKHSDGSHLFTEPEKLARLFIEQNIDLVHANSTSTSVYSGAAAKLAAIPSAGHIREIQKLSSNKIELICKNDFLIAVSHATGRSLTSQGVPDSKIKVIHNGINQDKFTHNIQNEILRNELCISGDIPLIGYIGQICLRKGIDTFMDSAKLLLRSIPDAHFVIVGERFSQKEESILLEQNIKNQSTAVPLKGHVSFTGYRNDIASIMNDLTLLVLPARQDPFPRVLLEAMAIGLPVVANNIGGVPELVVNNRTGFIVPPDDPASMSDAMLEIISDPQLQILMKKEAHKRCTMFTQKSVADNFQKIYHSLLN